MNYSHRGRIPSDLLEKAIDLRNLGIDEMAWKYPTIFDVIQFFTDNSYVLLGGDVFRMNEQEIQSTGDSWFIDVPDGVPLHEFVNASKTRAEEYITLYQSRNGDDFLYSIVIAK